MIARYKGQLVKVVRIEAHRAIVVYRGMQRRVNRAHIELVIDAALVALFVLSMAARGD